MNRRRGRDSGARPHDSDALRPSPVPRNCSKIRQLARRRRSSVFNRTAQATENRWRRSRRPSSRRHRLAISPASGSPSRPWRSPFRGVIPPTRTRVRRIFELKIEHYEHSSPFPPLSRRSRVRSRDARSTETAPRTHLESIEQPFSQDPAEAAPRRGWQPRRASFSVRAMARGLLVRRRAKSIEGGLCVASNPPRRDSFCSERVLKSRRRPPAPQLGSGVHCLKLIRGPKVEAHPPPRALEIIAAPRDARRSYTRPRGRRG